MNNYWFNRQEILQKAKKKKNTQKKLLRIKTKQTSHKGKLKERYKILSQEEKDKIKEYQKIYIKNWFNIKK